MEMNEQDPNAVKPYFIPNYPYLARIAQSQGSNISYLEIGVFLGGSATAVISTGCVGRAVLIDDWSQEFGDRGSPQKVLNRLGEHASKATIISASSRTALPMLHGTFDMVYVDGDHTEAGAAFDLGHALRLVSKPFGVICVDDIDNSANPNMRKLVTGFSKDNGLTFTFYNVHTGLAELRFP